MVMHCIADGRLAESWANDDAMDMLPPNGAVFTPEYASTTSMHRVADGKLAASWVVFDALGLMQQLGIIPTPEETG